MWEKHGNMLSFLTYCLLYLFGQYLCGFYNITVVLYQILNKCCIGKQETLKTLKKSLTCPKLLNVSVRFYTYIGLKHFSTSWLYWCCNPVKICRVLCGHRFCKSLLKGLCVRVWMCWLLQNSTKSCLFFSASLLVCVFTFLFSHSFEASWPFRCISL